MIVKLLSRHLRECSLEALAATVRGASCIGCCSRQCWCVQYRRPGAWAGGGEISWPDNNIRVAQRDARVTVVTGGHSGLNSADIY